MMMAFNLRGRLENINGDDAGNYESAIDTILLGIKLRKPFVLY